MTTYFTYKYINLYTKNGRYKRVLKKDNIIILTYTNRSATRGDIFVTCQENIRKLS